MKSGIYSSFLAITLFVYYDLNAQLSYQFNLKFSGRPISVLSDSDGKIYYAHRDDYDVRVHDQDGNFLYKFGATGSGAQNFSAYDGLTFDSNGLLFIPDGENKRIQVFTKTGTFQRTITFSGAGTYINGLAFDSDKNLYILDFWNNRCVVLDQNDNFLRTFSTGTSRTRGITIDGNNQVYISSDDLKVKLYSSTGNFIKDFLEPGYVARPTALYCSNSVLFVIDENTIKFFSLDGNSLGQLGGSGSDDNNFNTPSGVFVTGKNIYVSDFNNGYVKVFTGKIPQAVNIQPIGSKKFGDLNFILSATSTSGLPIAFSSSNPSILSISSDIASIHGAGMVNIIANQAGDIDYLSATSTIQLLIDKANQSITFNEIEPRSVSSSAFQLTAISSSGLPVSYSSSNSDVISLSGNMATILGGGTTIITATQGGNNNYYAAENVLRTLIVNKLDQTITFPVVNPRVIGDPAFELSATATSGLPITYSLSNSAVATLVNNLVIPTGAGSVTITASQNGNSTYSSAETISRELLIEKKSQSIFFESIPILKEGVEPLQINATATSELPLVLSIDDPSIATISSSKILTVLKSGVTTIRANQSGNSIYKSASEVARSLQVDMVTGDLFEVKSLSVFPNPCQDFAQILLPDQDDYSYQLVDIFGKPLKIKFEKFESSIQVDLRGTQPGLYFIQVKNNKGVKVIRLIKSD